MGGQPGRSGQPPARRLRRAPRGADGGRATPRSGWSPRGAAIAPRAARHLPVRRLPPGARAAAGRREHVVAFLRGDDVLVAVSRWTVAAGRNRLGRNHFDLPDGQLDRPADRPALHRRGRRRPSCSPTCPWRCWSGPMPEHEFAVWAPRPERVRLDVDGTLHPMTRSDDGWWRADRRRARRRPLRLRPRRRRHGAARSALAPPARRRARALAAVGCRDRRRGPTPTGAAARSRAR